MRSLHSDLTRPRRFAPQAWLVGAVVALSACAAGGGVDPEVLAQRGRGDEAAVPNGLTTAPAEFDATTTSAARATGTMAAERATTTSATSVARATGTTVAERATTTAPPPAAPATTNEPTATTTSLPVAAMNPCRPGSKPAPQAGERNVVFYRQGLGNGLMWVRPDGSAAELVAADAFPQAWWSPDGEQLAYSGHDDKVWIVEADGSRRWSLATSGIIELAWAPDGERFAATLRLPDGTRDVFLLDGRGKVVRQLTDTHGIPGRLSWSPDGSVVAYTRASEAPPSRLWAVSADGGDSVLIAENAIGASWSPDGCRIATATPDGAVVLRWDGTDRRLIPDSAHRTPQFSPTGELISLEAQGGDGIFVLAAEDLTSAERIFDGNAYGLQWSPDGTRIAFYGRNPTSAGTDFEVSSIKADGTAPLNLSRHPENDVQPHW